MLRYASSFVTAAYKKVRLIPQDLRALPADFFTKPSTHHNSFPIGGETKTQDRKMVTVEEEGWAV
jgi:hypothetical protein